MDMNFKCISSYRTTTARYSLKCEVSRQDKGRTFLTLLPGERCMLLLDNVGEVFSFLNNMETLNVVCSNRNYQSNPINHLIRAFNHFFIARSHF